MAAWGVRAGVAVVCAATLATAVPTGATPRPTGDATPAGAWVTTLPLQQQSRQMLSAFHDGTAYVMDVGGSATTLWHSARYGVGWDALTYLPAGLSGFAQARFGTDRVGYLIDYDRVLTTSDGATTATSWKALPGPRLHKGDVMEALTLGVTGSTVAIGGGVLGPLHPGCNTDKSVDIWTSHDGGRSWVDGPLPADAMVGAVRYANARDGVALAWEMKPDGNPCEYLGSTNSVYVTHDGGRHFIRALRCAHASGELCTAAMFRDSRRLLVGRNDGTMTSSVNGGRTFHEEPGLGTVVGLRPTQSAQDESFWIQGFAEAGGTLYATTKLAGAYLSTNGGQTWTRETTCDTAYSLGIGEVAAFDGARAIAGGPTCLSTRTTTVAAAAPGAVPPAGAAPAAGRVPGVDWVASRGGLSLALTGGRALLRRLR